MPDDAEEVALQFADRIGKGRELASFFPAAGVYQSIVVMEPMRQREQHGKYMLHDRRCAIVAQVADRDTRGTGRGDVDVVDTRRGQRYEPEPRVPGDRGAVDDRLVGEHDLETGDACADLVGESLLMDYQAGQHALERPGVEVAVADCAKVQKYRAHAGNIGDRENDGLSRTPDCPQGDHAAGLAPYLLEPYTFSFL